VVVTTEAELTSSIEDLSDGAAILALSGEIDLATAPVMIARFQELANKGTTDVIIDARGVTFIDSTGLHGLVKGKRIIHETGSKIVLVPSAPVRRLLELVFPEPLFAARLETMDEAFTFLGIEK
jgi:anti-sigma B factor antagonist